MDHCNRTLGANFYLTPRDSVKAFVGFLSVLEQNPSEDWRSLLCGVRIEQTADPESVPVPDAELAESQADASVQSDNTQAGGDNLAAFQI